MSKSNILLIVNQNDFDFENRNSAVASYLKLLREALVTSGYNVDLFPLSSTTDRTTQVSIDRKSFSVFKFLKSILKKITPKIYYSTILFKIVCKQRKNRFLEKDKPYRMIIEFYTIGSVAGIELKKKHNCKFLLIYDCPVLLQYKEMYRSNTFLDKLMMKVEKKSIEAADCILCYSDSMKKYIQQNYTTNNVFFEMPCIVWKGEVIKSKPVGNEITIGFIGSFLNWHKVPLLLEAFNSIAAKYPNLKLYLIGYGEEWNRVAELVTKSPYYERIYMPGFVSEDELNKIKNEISIGVMPGSNWYGSPLKLFEYAEAGIPIIAPSTPVVKDLFENKNAVLFIEPKRELSTLVENIELLINNKQIAETLSSNAKNLMHGEYSKTDQMNNFIKLVQNLLIDGIEK